MKVSTVILAVSSGINAAAAAVSARVVVPSLRAAGSLKQHGLNRVYKEHDEAYWRTVNEAQDLRKMLLHTEAQAKALDSKRMTALKAARKFPRERVI